MLGQVHLLWKAVQPIPFLFSNGFVDKKKILARTAEQIIQSEEFISPIDHLALFVKFLQIANKFPQNTLGFISGYFYVPCII